MTFNFHWALWKGVYEPVSLPMRYWRRSSHHNNIGCFQVYRRNCMIHVLSQKENVDDSLLHWHNLQPPPKSERRSFRFAQPGLIFPTSHQSYEIDVCDGRSGRRGPSQIKVSKPRQVPTSSALAHPEESGTQPRAWGFDGRILKDSSPPKAS